MSSVIWMLWTVVWSATIHIDPEPEMLFLPNTITERMAWYDICDSKYEYNVFLVGLEKAP